MIQCDLLFLMVEELMIEVYDIIYIGKLIKKLIRIIYIWF